MTTGLQEFTRAYKSQQEALTAPGLQPQEEEYIEKWILADVIDHEQTPEVPFPHMTCIFELADQSELRDWIFIELSRSVYEQALQDLRRYVGERVNSLIDYPPSYLRINFEDGFCWTICRKPDIK